MCQQRTYPKGHLPALCFGLLAAFFAVGRAANAADASPGDHGGAAAQRPNVVLIMPDDVGYGDLGIHGNEQAETPALDALAQQGVRLTDFHVDPTCSETRAALMTGRYAMRTGVWHTVMGRSILRRDEITMAEVLRSAGYATGIFGKWHLGDTYPYRPEHRGFEEVLIHGGGGMGQTPDYWDNDYFDDHYWNGARWEQREGYCTDVYFAAAGKFIAAHRDRPFFCYIAPNAAHWPYRAPEEYAERFRRKGMTGDLAHFYGMIANIDDNVGRLLAQLDALDLTRRTIVIFMTDNGTALGDFSTGLRGRKGSHYEGGHRVPCFIRWPGGGIDGGRTSHRLASHFDLLPTLAEWCGAPLPEGLRLDGRSLAPLLTGREADWPQRTLVVQSQRIDEPQPWRNCAVMTDRWRLVSGRELYDMARDRGQQQDIAAAHPEVVAELRAAYERWWEDVAQRNDVPARLLLGAEGENPTRLTSHDWSAPLQEVPWDQNHIRREQFFPNGFWRVDFVREGRYRFVLRRWPREAAAAGRDSLEAIGAELQVGNRVVGRSGLEGAAEAVFEMDELPAGPANLRTRLVDAAGRTRGAYYVYVEYLGP